MYYVFHFRAAARIYKLRGRLCQKIALYPKMTMHMGVSINNRVAIYGNKTRQYELTINLKSLNQILNGFCEIEPGSYATPS